MSSFINTIVSNISIVVPKRRLLGPLLFSVFCVLSLGVIGFYLGHQVKVQSDSINRRRQIIRNVDRLQHQSKELQSMQNGYLATRDKTFLTELYLFGETKLNIAQIKQLIIYEDQKVQKDFTELSEKLEIKLKNLQRNLDLAAKPGFLGGENTFRANADAQLNSEIIQLAEHIVSQQEVLLAKEREERESEMKELLSVVFLGSSGAFIILFFSYSGFQKQITHLSLAEQKAKNALNTLQNIVDTVPDPMLILEGDLRVMGAGRSFYETFDLTPSKAEGTLIYEMGNREWDIPQFRKLLGEVLSTQGRAADFEVTNVFPKLGERTWLVSARRMSSEIPGLPGILVSLKDISLRKKAERRVHQTMFELQNLRDALELKVAERTRELTNKQEFLNRAVAVANLGIFDHNLSNDDLFFSQEMRRICGFKQDEPLVFSDWVKRLFPDDRAEVMKLILEAQSPEGSGLLSLEHRIVLPDASIRWVSTKALTFFEDMGANKHPIRTIGVTLDITDRKKSERIIQETLNSLALKTSNLEESNKSLERFAAVAAHDLRAPIRSISLWVELLETYIPKPWSGELSNALQFLKCNANKSGVLIDDLLEIAKVKHLPAKMEKVDLNQVISQILISLKSEIDKQNAQIAVSKLPVVEGSIIQWESVFGNLIRNGLIYHKKSFQPEINIWAEENESSIKFCIKDNGIGIPNEYQQKIFEMFERLHTDLEYPGTGIGLALCKKIVEGWGGTISVSSELNKGSTFFVSYPKSAIATERRIA